MRNAGLGHVTHDKRLSTITHQKLTGTGAASTWSRVPLMTCTCSHSFESSPHAHGDPLKMNEIEYQRVGKIMASSFDVSPDSF